MTQKFSLRELCEALLCEMKGDPEYIVTGVDGLTDASESDLSYYAKSSLAANFEKTKAGIICVSQEFKMRKGRNFLISDNPAATFEKAAMLICKDASKSGFTGIHPTATVHQSVKLGKNVELGPYVVIDRDCEIGDGTVIRANVTIGPETKIGKNCLIHPNAVIRERCTLKDRVIIQPGAIIGGCGYGYSQNAMNQSQKLKHYGGVTLEDDVEIGSNATIDRGRFKDTVVGKGAKIDNLVMLAHNSKIGENTLVIAQCGIAGSTTIGKNCIIAAQAGLVDHINICDQVIIGAKSGVGKSITKPGIYGSGFFSAPAEAYRRRIIHLNRLDEYVKVLKSLQKRVKELEGATEAKGAC